MRYPICILLLMVTGASWAQSVAVPSTRVALEPPAGFALASGFPGFIDPDAEASITVAETPASFLELHDDYSDAALRQSDLRVVNREMFERDGLRGVLIRGESVSARPPIVKQILLTGDVEQSLRITAKYPQSQAAKLDEPIRRALKNAHWDGSQLLDHFEGLGFRLEEIPGLQVATRVSNSVIFTRDGRLPDEFYTGKILIAGWSKGDKSTLADVRAFSRRRFENIKLLTDVEIDNIDTIAIDGNRGIEIVGRGTHRYLGYNVAAFQLIVEYPTRLLLAQGFASLDEPELAYGQFRTVVSTLSTSE